MGALIGLPPSLVEIYGGDIKKMYKANGVPLYFGLIPALLSTFLHLMLKMCIRDRCGTTSSAATAWKRLFPCGPPSARERIRTSRFSNPKQTCCWIPAFPTRCAVLRLLSPRCGVSLRRERLMRRSWKACAAVLHCACPVSYTHLDVYKRQVLAQEGLAQNGFTMQK